jgi:hypothetical protein
VRNKFLAKGDRPNVRKCLRCDRQFNSSGHHNRVCLQCNYINDTFLTVEKFMVFDINGNRRKAFIGKSGG